MIVASIQKVYLAIITGVRDLIISLIYQKTFQKLNYLFHYMYLFIHIFLINYKFLLAIHYVLLKFQKIQQKLQLIFQLFHFKVSFVFLSTYKLYSNMKKIYKISDTC